MFELDSFWIRPSGFRRGLLGSVFLTLAAAAAPASAGAASGPGSPSTPEDGRVLVLGFDGADWRTTERMMDSGELPNMAKLRSMGSAGPLVSTDPAESAAGWAAINTGANPLKNGVPSFIKRTISDGGFISPGFAHVEAEPRSVADMDATGAQAALGGSDRSMMIGGAVFLVGFLLLKLAIKANAMVSLLLSLLLGGAAGFATRTAGEGLPEEIAGVVANKVQMDGFWVEAARAGYPSVALQAPLAFDRPGAEGARTLFGLGLPDVRTSYNGDWFIYTTDTLASGRAPKGDASSSNSGTGIIYRVDFKKPKDGGARAIDTSIYGPLNFVEMDRIRRRLAELEKEIAEAQDYKSSRALADEQEDLEKIYAEMGQIPGRAGKEYKHRATVPMRVEAGAEEGSWEVTIGSQTQTLTLDGWSDFYQMEFELSPLVSVPAVTRARVLGADPFELYIDTLQFDPAKPSFWQPTSSPLGFSAELAQGIGSTFETLGWGCMTNQIKDELLDPEVFLEDVEFTMTFRRKLMQRMLEDEDWRVLYSVFSTTDRVQHMMYRYYDPEHPMYDAEEASRKVTFFGEEIELRDAIPAIYRQMDSIVGEAMEALRDDDTLMLCADHGFTSYRRGMHVNNWLASEGFLTLKEGLDSTAGGFAAIDWSKTKAYSLGLGMVFLNLEGREPAGIVKREDARGVLEAIQERFLAAEDEGRKVGSSATIIQDVYEGPVAWGTKDYPCSDLMLGFAEFYRVSWSTVGGGLPVTRDDSDAVVPKPTYSDNTNLWSGDHASNDPNVVTGIFFCSRKVTSEDGTFSVMDIAPTVLSRLGAPLPAALDRPALTFD
jgi:predicted AlkP superfamily phosphohydrolase/phosphomutase